VRQSFTCFLARVLEQGHGHLKGSSASASALARGGEKVCTVVLSGRLDDLLDAFERHEHAEGVLLHDFFFLRAGEEAIQCERGM